jgi:hypothetical protein
MGDTREEMKMKNGEYKIIPIDWIKEIIKKIFTLKITIMRKTLLLFAIASLFFLAPLWGQNSPSRGYMQILDDAQFDVGVRLTSIFAFDDRAPLSSNPHYRAMWNLIKLGASLESLLQGFDEPLNDINMNRKFGQNGYNRTILSLFCRYGFGESSDLKLQRNFLELSLSPGYFKEGNGGMNIHLDYQYSLLRTNYGAGVQSLDRLIDYEVIIGGRIGFDWSFGRSEKDAGFFATLQEEIKRVANENEFTAAQLIMLENLAEDSKVLLPEDIGGRAFHLGPIAGAQFSMDLLDNMRLFANGIAFYDVMDLTSGNGKKENLRSQHHLSLSLGLNLTIGSRGEVVVHDFF